MSFANARYAAYSLPIMTTYFADAIQLHEDGEDGPEVLFRKKSGKEFTVSVEDIVSLSKTEDGVTVIMLVHASTSAPFPLVRPPEAIKGMGLVKLTRHPDGKVLLIPRNRLVLYSTLPKDSYEARTR